MITCCWNHTFVESLMSLHWCWILTKRFWNKEHMEWGTYLSYVSDRDVAPPCLLTIIVRAPPVLINNHCLGPTSAYWQSLFRPHQYLSTIIVRAPPVLIDNHSSNPTSAYQQSFFWPHQCLSTIILLSPHILINDHSSGHTHTYQWSFFWLHKYLSTIILLAPQVLINDHSLNDPGWLLPQ